ncbi:MAG: hypothetical protein JSW25_05170 [Thermoplasmata archaeon]|nr:MAG: hypothetical protein JSW25_05170 [Thermoplasmata archaeon]
MWRRALRWVWMLGLVLALALVVAGFMLWGLMGSDEARAAFALAFVVFMISGTLAALSYNNPPAKVVHARNTRVTYHPEEPAIGREPPDERARERW